MPIGATLKYACKQKGLTLKQLSKISGVPYSTIKGISSRDPESISATTEKKLCRALGMDPQGLSIGSLLGCPFYSKEQLENAKFITQDSNFSMLINIPGYRLTTNSDGVIILEYPGGKTNIYDDELDELEKLCSHLLKYEIDQFIQKKTDSNK